MPTIAMVSGGSTTYPTNGLALGAGSTFTINAPFSNFFISDDDTTFNGDEITNETPDDLGQTIDVGGTNVPIAYDYAFQASSGGVTYTFATIDVDLNNDGDFGNGTTGGVDPGENVVYIAVLGPSTPVIPPGGLTFTVTTTVSDNTNQPFANFICFAAGTGIRTQTGFRPIEEVGPGDLVWTEREKFEPVVWTGARLTVATGDKAPIALAGRPGCGGEKLVVSPQHRIRVASSRLELMTGHFEVLVKARDLARCGLAQRQKGGLVSYHHILLERHALVETCSGHWAESLFPGMETLKTLDPEAYAEVTELFPELRQPVSCGWKFVRPLLKQHEAHALYA